MANLPKYTVRGREIGSLLVQKKNENPLGKPIMGRQRSNSLRRLPEEKLQDLQLNHEDPQVKLAAGREIGIRQDLIKLSVSQFSPKPLMNALEKIGKREVEAMRFASSMAEEAQDEIVRDVTKYQEGSKKIGQLGQIGIARVGPFLGLGFSGTSKEMTHTRWVEQRMLELQQDYDQRGLSSQWSGRLVPVQVPEIFAKDDGNICAAKRASLVAHTLNRSFLAPGPIDRSLIPPPDSLIEMMSPALSGRGNVLTNFSALAKNPNLVKKDVYSTIEPKTISGRPRSASVGNMANSCETCMKEHEEHMKKRTDI